MPGHYDGDVGSFDAPLAQMPDTGWFVLVKDTAGSYVRRIPDAASGRPLFLRELETATIENGATLQSALGQLFYLNLPRIALREGPLTEVPLRRRALVPVNGRAYALTLGTTPFTLTVNNGLKGRAGAHYVIELAGEKHEYLLDGFGWDSEIQYAGDLDRDGKPDFIVYVNGNNSGTWYVLLSSQASSRNECAGGATHRHGLLTECTLESTPWITPPIGEDLSFAAKDRHATGCGRPRPGSPSAFLRTSLPRSAADSCAMRDASI